MSAIKLIYFSGQVRCVFSKDLSYLNIDGCRFLDYSKVMGLYRH